MSKDWTGNTHSTMVTLGASNHAQNDREQHDFYATEPKAVTLLLGLEKFDNVWECACGTGHMAEALAENYILGKATDLIDRGYGLGGVDFLQAMEWDGDIITNPPYKYANKFVEKALEIVPQGRKVAMFLRVQFLEGKYRKGLFQRSPPKVVYVSSTRLKCAINGNFDSMTGSASCYCWFVWEKGYTGDTIIKWFN